MMRRELFHICGPFSINSYGVAIVIGILVFMWLAQHHRLRKQFMTHDQFMQGVLTGIVLGVFGGRLLYVIENYHGFTSWYEMVAFWEYGGFSVLGSILSIVLLMPWYLHKNAVPILPFLDLVALFAPLLQSISRLGCLMAGCCYGLPTNLPWAILYTDEQSVAPLYERIHPTQIYSSISLLLIFCFMYFIAQYLFKKPGQLATLYLLLSSASRFTVDYWRADHEPLANMPFDVSGYQLLALSIIVVSGTLFGFITWYSSKRYA